MPKCKTGYYNTHRKNIGLEVLDINCSNIFQFLSESKRNKNKNKQKEYSLNLKDFAQPK